MRRVWLIERQTKLHAAEDELTTRIKTPFTNLNKETVEKAWGNPEIVWRPLLKQVVISLNKSKIRCDVRIILIFS